MNVCGRLWSWTRTWLCGSAVHIADAVVSKASPSACDNPSVRALENWFAVKLRTNGLNDLSSTKKWKILKSRDRASTERIIVVCCTGSVCQSYMYFIGSYIYIDQIKFIWPIFIFYIALYCFVKPLDILLKRRNVFLSTANLGQSTVRISKTVTLISKATAWQPQIRTCGGYPNQKYT